MTAFTLPPELEAAEPPSRRDAVRLLVAGRDGITHAAFSELATYLEPGDLVVVNTSATLAAAVDGHRRGQPVTVHFASALDDGEWVVEIRPRGRADGPLGDVRDADVITLPDGVQLTMARAYPATQARLWRARVGVEGSVVDYLARHGRPIRYAYVPRSQPIEQYQTIFAREAGSAEMPSAGRPFSDRLVTELITAGVGLAPITLHAGVSSPDVAEPPQAERFRVPESTARQVNMTRAWGGRVVAVGTTVTRALETAADGDGVVRGRSGWTEVVLGADRPAVVVSGLVTGWHAPGASHLELLQAVAGRELVVRAYAEALRAEYLWHEFGDSCLLLP
jgi:S-adenosylmethionine:tRNA ribosyltransferase-isomerase